MQHYTFPYTEVFHCTAGDCPDSCCKGWEIVIDPKTLQTYQQTCSQKMKTMSGCFKIGKMETVRSGTQKNFVTYKYKLENACSVIPADSFHAFRRIIRFLQSMCSRLPVQRLPV